MVSCRGVAEEVFMHAQARIARARVVLPAIVALAVSAVFSAPTQAQRKERLGNEVVDAACGSCHSTGKDKAPRIGDAKAWSARASQGLSALTEHALKGIRAMPAHGGSPGVSDIEIERAIVYMVNHSGGHWVEPIGGATPTVVRASAAVVQAQCANCHQDGQQGAPKIGDRQAWIPHLQKGLDPLVASAIHGHGSMPARGGLADLSDQEIRGAIVYMFSYGLPETPPEPPQARADANHKLVSGTDVYFGMMSADAIRASQAGRAGIDPAGVPAGTGYYHLNIALVDNKTQVQITDAVVRLRVSEGMRAETQTLGLVAANNAVSYGGFFQLASGKAYDISAQVQRPGATQAITTSFTFRAP
jgi:cytochrome c5